MQIFSIQNEKKQWNEVVSVRKEGAKKWEKD